MIRQWQRWRNEDQADSAVISRSDVITLLDEIDRLRATLAENDRLRLEIERLREHLARIEEWSRAYPRTVFPEPALKRAADVLRAGGMTLDAISAHAMRHVVEGVGEIARCGLEGER